MDDCLKIGDIVVKKGFSYPLMAISKVQDGRVLCTWSDQKSRNNHEAWFRAVEVSAPPEKIGPMNVWF